MTHGQTRGPTRGPTWSNYGPTMVQLWSQPSQELETRDLIKYLIFENKSIYKNVYLNFQLSNFKL
jgi:hypothetical protein